MLKESTLAFNCNGTATNTVYRNTFFCHIQSYEANMSESEHAKNTRLHLVNFSAFAIDTINEIIYYKEP